MIDLPELNFFAFDNETRSCPKNVKPHLGPHDHFKQFIKFQPFSRRISQFYFKKSLASYVKWTSIEVNF